MLVRDAMTHEVVTTTPSTPLADVADQMLRYGVTGIPVVQRDRTVLGVITEADLIAKAGYPLRPRSTGRTVLDELFHPDVHRWASKAEGRVAADSMTSPAITVPADATLRRAAETMITRSIKRLPVVDHEGKLVGIISQRDLLRLVHHRDDELLAQVRLRLADPLFCPDRHSVTASVDHGVVTLDGWVERADDLLVVEAAARSVLGVIDVTTNARVGAPAAKA